MASVRDGLRDVFRQRHLLLEKQARVERLLPLALTVSQVGVLELLPKHGAMSCGQIAEAQCTSRGNLTGIVDRLEAKGLVARTRGKGERRTVIVELTSQGAAVLRELDAIQVSAGSDKAEQDVEAVPA